MLYSGAKLVTLLSFLIHFALVDGSFYILQLSSDKVLVVVIVVQSLVYMCYPVIGWLADTRFTRYLMIKMAFVTLLIVSLLGLAILVASTVFKENIAAYPMPWYMILVVALPIAATIFAVGLFEATAIQFGMDQMLEASSDQISAFIHWYYWSIQLSRGLMVLISIFIDILLRVCLFDLTIRNRSEANIFPGIYVLLIIILIQGVMSAIGTYLLLQCKKDLTIEPAGQSPFSTVFKVLKYAWQHKSPERRSALTYWEEDIPPRIDLGKSKYGGPFTTEEVEDTKTLFSILLLLVSLFGFHLADNGYSVFTSLVGHRLCPNRIILTVILSSPNVLDSLVIVVSVPVLHYIILPHCRRCLPNMIQRLGLSLAIILLQELAGIVIVYISSVHAKYTDSSCVTSDNELRKCYLSRSSFIYNNTCGPLNGTNYQWCSEDNGLFLWLLLPEMLLSFSYQLGFMTALEFISAQAPFRIKGLLVSVWYALSILQIQVLDIYVRQDTQRFISHGIKCFLIFISLMVYCCVARRYRYRVRDEVVPIQFMIEEKYERDFQLAEEYEREKREEMRALLEHIGQNDVQSLSDVLQ